MVGVSKERTVTTTRRLNLESLVPPLFQRGPPVPGLIAWTAERLPLNRAKIRCGSFDESAV